MKHFCVYIKQHSLSKNLIFFYGHYIPKFVIFIIFSYLLLQAVQLRNYIISILPIFFLRTYLLVPNILLNSYQESVSINLFIYFLHYMKLFPSSLCYSAYPTLCHIIVKCLISLDTIIFYWSCTWQDLYIYFLFIIF